MRIHLGGKGMRRKQKALILLAVLLVAAVVSYRFIRSKGQTDPTAIRVSGNIEVTDVEVSFKIPGRVEERAVSEGEMVKAGQPVARLDRSELVEEVASRRAEVAAVQAALAEMLAGSRPEEIGEAEAAVHKAQSWLDELSAGSRPQDIAAQNATVERAKVEVDRLESEYTRQKTLYRDDVISTREYETTRGCKGAIPRGPRTVKAGHRGTSKGTDRAGPRQLETDNETSGAYHKRSPTRNDRSGAGSPGASQTGVPPNG
jgi:HlyD family secretion protein